MLCTSDTHVYVEILVAVTSGHHSFLLLVDPILRLFIAGYLVYVRHHSLLICTSVGRPGGVSGYPRAWYRSVS